MLRLLKNKVRWEMEPSFAPLLDRVLASSGGTIKESAAKIVTEHSVAKSRYFVKRYRHHAVAFRPLKFFFKKSQAREEWDLAGELASRKIPIVRHVALGERWSWRGLEESILITEGFDGKQLDEATQYDANDLLRFVNRLHENGVLQRDLHLGNILINELSGELRLVDLHGTELKSSLSPVERDRNLAYLRIFAPIPVSAAVAALSRELRKTAFAERSARCWKSNRDFGCKRLGERHWQVRFAGLNPAAEKIMEHPDEFFARRSNLLKDGQSSTVGHADGFVLKRYNFRKWENLVKDLFRPSKGRKAFRKAYHLELAGVRTARAVATADDRMFFHLRSYFLMEEIRGAVRLEKCRGDDDEIVQNIARLLAKLHDEGFQHRDLKPSNLLVNASREAHLIDLDGLEFVGNVSNERAGADLARLLRGWEKAPGFGTEQRELFLKRYSEFRGQD